jgi:hypothetical protein
MRIFGREQVAESMIVFLVRVVVSAAPVQPMLEMFACGGGEFGEEESGAALVAGPHHVGVSL